MDSLLPKTASYMPLAPLDERASAVSHLLGVLAILGGGVWLFLALPEVTSWSVRYAVLIFILSAATLFTVSFVYHISTSIFSRRLWQRLDHAAIYCLIAGTCTPFAVSHPITWIRISFLTFVWTAAFFGCLLKLFRPTWSPLSSTASYLILGWSALLLFMSSDISPTSLLFILLGGTIYTLGCVIYHFDSRIKLGHFYWHLATLAGFGCHFYAISLHLLIPG